MKITIREQIYVETKNQNIIKELKSLLDKPNPEYAKKRAMGYMIYNIPPRIKMYQKMENGLIIPRGTGRLARELAKKHNELFVVEDQRVEGLSINVRLKESVIPFWYQKESVKAMNLSQQGLLEAPCGCLVGETNIRFNRAGKGFSKSLDQSYKSFNGLQDHPMSNWTKNIPTYIRAFNGKTIQLHEVDEIVYSGKKIVYEMILENENKITGTSDHKILTSIGWVELKDCISKMIICDTPNAISKNNTKSHKGDIRVGGLHHHPYARKQNENTPQYTKLAEIHRLIYEAYINGLQYDEFLEIIRTNEMKAERLIYIDPSKFHIHHIDGNHTNNNIKNLETKTVSEHQKLHSITNRFNFNQGIPQNSKCISITNIGIRKTYDIICKEPHHNFSANDIIVHNSGKTTMGLMFIAEKKKATIIVVHTKDLLNQWYDRIHEFLEGEFTVGQIGDGKKSHGDITIAMIQTLTKFTDWNYIREKYGIFIGDESHHFGANTYIKCMQNIQSKWVFGLTATPKRKDKKDFIVNAYLGNIFHKVTYDDLETSGRSVTCVINICETKCKYNFTKMGENFSALGTAISNDKERNELIVQNIMEDLNDDRVPIVLTERVYHASYLVSLLRAEGLKVDSITGSVESSKRELIKSNLKNHKIQVLVANKQIAAEGLDLPIVDSIHICFLTNNKQLLKQMIGRGRRVYENKEYCRVWFYKDFIYRTEYGSDYKTKAVEFEGLKYQFLSSLKWFKEQNFTINK